jgi:aspartate-semialdehyde dehydrogenase
LAKAVAKAGGLAIVGGDTLLGREVREVLSHSGLGLEPKLIAGGEEEGRGVSAEIGAAGKPEVTILETLEEAALTQARVVVLAGTAASSWKAVTLAGERGPRFVDATGALRERTEAALRAPALELPETEVKARVQVIAHPAAVALALFFRRLHAIEPLRAAVVTAFEPASERGQRGLDELHQQTVRLLSFQSLPKEIYDAQIGFNMLSAYGEDAPLALAAVERRIARDLEALVAGAPAPSLRLIQAPVFHGYSFSVWAEFEKAPELERCLRELEGPGIEIRGEGHEPPTNVGAAGQSGITVGSVAADARQGRAAWLWVVADNLRITAEGVREVVREMVA